MADQCDVDFFAKLWAPSPTTGRPCDHVFVPETVILGPDSAEHASPPFQVVPKTWYFVGKDGRLLRKHQKNTTCERILQRFLKHREDGSRGLSTLPEAPAATFGYRTSEGDLRITYLDRQGLRKFLKQPMPFPSPGRYVFLQKFVPTLYASMFRVHWTPQLCVMDKRVNRRAISIAVMAEASRWRRGEVRGGADKQAEDHADTDKNLIEERVQYALLTFERKKSLIDSFLNLKSERVADPVNIRAASVTTYLQTSTNAIASHLLSVGCGPLKAMEVYYKQDEHGLFWLLFPSWLEFRQLDLRELLRAGTKGPFLHGFLSGKLTIGYQEPEDEPPEPSRKQSSRPRKSMNGESEDGHEPRSRTRAAVVDFAEVFKKQAWVWQPAAKELLGDRPFSTGEADIFEQSQSQQSNSPTGFRLRSAGAILPSLSAKHTFPKKTDGRFKRWKLLDIQSLGLPAFERSQVPRRPSGRTGPPRDEPSDCRPRRAIVPYEPTPSARGAGRTGINLSVINGHHDGNFEVFNDENDDEDDSDHSGSESTDSESGDDDNALTFPSRPVARKRQSVSAPVARTRRIAIPLTNNRGWSADVRWTETQNRQATLSHAIKNYSKGLVLTPKTPDLRKPGSKEQRRSARWSPVKPRVSMNWSKTPRTSSSASPTSSLRMEKLEHFEEQSEWRGTKKRPISKPLKWAYHINKPQPKPQSPPKYADTVEADGSDMNGVPSLEYLLGHARMNSIPESRSQPYRKDVASTMKSKDDFLSSSVKELLQIQRTVLATCYRGIFAAINASCLASADIDVSPATLDKAADVLFSSLSECVAKHQIRAWLDQVGHVRRAAGGSAQMEMDLARVYQSCIAATVRCLELLRVDITRKGQPTPKEKVRAPTAPARTTKRNGDFGRGPKKLVTANAEMERKQEPEARRWCWLCRPLQDSRDRGATTDTHIIDNADLKLLEILEDTSANRMAFAHSTAHIETREAFCVGKFVHEQSGILLFSIMSMQDAYGSGWRLSLEKSAKVRVCRLMQPLAWGSSKMGRMKGRETEQRFECWINPRTSKTSWARLLSDKFVQKNLVYRFSWFLLSLLGDATRSCLARMFTLMRTTSVGGIMDERRLYNTIGPSIMLLSRPTLARIVVWFQQNSRGVFGGHDQKVVELVEPVMCKTWMCLPYLRVASPAFTLLDESSRPFQRIRGYDACVDGGLADADIFPGWYSQREAKLAMNRKPDANAPIGYTDPIVKHLFCE